MNRPLTLATAVLAAGAIIVGTTGCSMGGEDTPAPATIETQAPTTATEQTTVTDQDQNDNQNDDNQNDNENQNDNQDQNDQAEGEAIGKAAESAGLSEAKKECLANAPSAADCADIP